MSDAPTLGVPSMKYKIRASIVSMKYEEDVVSVTLSPTGSYVSPDSQKAGIIFSIIGSDDYRTLLKGKPNNFTVKLSTEKSLLVIINFISSMMISGLVAEFIFGHNADKEDEKLTESNISIVGIEFPVS